MKGSIPLIVVLAIAAAGWVFAAASDAQACDSCAQHAKAKAASEAPTSFDSPPAVGSKATCPVMKQAFVVKADNERSTFKGRHVVFCCSGCKKKFDADPSKYL